MHLDLPSLFAAYGYAMLLVGSFADGTPVMLFGGFAAHRGWMVLFPHAVLVGALGNFLACGAWFLLARSLGSRLVDRRPSWRSGVERMRRALERWGAPVVVLARFVPGFGITGFIAAGLTDMPPRRFALLNALGALAWATAYGSLGYAGTDAVEALLGEARRYELPAALLLLAVAAAWIVARQYLRRRTQAGAAGTGL